jgi:hypothetical protein
VLGYRVETVWRPGTVPINSKILQLGVGGVREEEERREEKRREEMRDGKIEGGRRYKTISERGGGEGREDTDISCIFPTEHKTNKTKQIKTKQNKTKQNKTK